MWLQTWARESNIHFLKKKQVYPLGRSSTTCLRALSTASGTCLKVRRRLSIDQSPFLQNCRTSRRRLRLLINSSPASGAPSVAQPLSLRAMLDTERPWSKYHLKTFCRPLTSRILAGIVQFRRPEENSTVFHTNTHIQTHTHTHINSNL